MKGFYGGGPGQDLSELVDQFSYDELSAVVGEDIIALVDAVSSSEEQATILRHIAAKLLQERTVEFLVRSDIRAICLKALSFEKHRELADRLGFQDIDMVRTFDPTIDANTWRKYREFFGIDTHGAKPFVIEPEKKVVRAKYGLFPHQRRVADRVYDAIKGGHGRVVLHMPTGAGKTRTAMHIVSQYMAMTEPSLIVWLATSRELLDQASDAFEHAWSFLGNREVEIVRFWGDYSTDLEQVTEGFVVAGLQKIHALKTRDHIGLLRFAKSIKLVVVDEAHQAIACTYREVIDILSETGTNNALVGLTATPGRTWSDIAADERLSKFFGEKKVMLEAKGWEDPVAFLMQRGYLAKPKFRKLEVASTHGVNSLIEKKNYGDDYDPILLEELASQSNRNVVILDEIRRLISAGHRRIIFFSSSVRHAEVIAATLTALGIDGRAVTAKTGSTSRLRAIKEFRASSSKPLVLCNFGVLTTGFDAPNTSAAVIARPTKSLVLFSQMVGRATRGPKAGGNTTCEISTVVDIGLPGFGDIAEAFTNWEDVWHDQSRSN